MWPAAHRDPIYEQYCARAAAALNRIKQYKQQVSELSARPQRLCATLAAQHNVRVCHQHARHVMFRQQPARRTRAGLFHMNATGCFAAAHKRTEAAAGVHPPRTHRHASTAATHPPPPPLLSPDAEPPVAAEAVGKAWIRQQRRGGVAAGQQPGAAAAAGAGSWGRAAGAAAGAAAGGHLHSAIVRVAIC